MIKNLEINMNTLESIGWIVFTMSWIAACACVLYTFIKWEKEIKQSHIKYQKYLKLLIPGSI